MGVQNQEDKYPLTSAVEPPENLNQPEPTKYPFDAMEKGNSFFVPSIQGSDFALILQGHPKKEGKEYAFCVEGAGVRCWCK